MKFLFISVAIVCSIQFVNAFSNTTANQISARSSVIFFKATPGVTEEYLFEDKQIQNLLNTLTTLGGPLGASGKFSTVITALTENIKKAVAPMNALKKLYIFLIKNIDTYATSKGTYNFPTSKVDEIVTNIQKIMSILQDIPKVLTKLIGGGNSVGFSIGGLQGFGGIPANPITAQLNLFTTAATDMQTFLTIFTNAQTSGPNTVMNLNDLMTRSLILLGALPNFTQTITSIMTAITNPLNSL